MSPRIRLVTGKNNCKGKYSFLELLSRALKIKANLFLEFTDQQGRVLTCIYDPLGNRYCQTVNINRVATTLMNRIQELLRYTRYGSRVLSNRTDLGHHLKKASLKIPDIDKDFYGLIKGYANKFHECIHGSGEATRLLGNASFRCERGFPSFMGDNGQIYVSRRNIDKRHVDPEGFVPVKMMVNDVLKKGVVAYHGDHKPSVDAPIHLLLYSYYKQMKYMIHSHTYIESAPFTAINIPCGAIEEFYEIIRLNSNRNMENIAMNLKGHGSIVMASRTTLLKDIKYYPREQPETVY